MTHLSQIARQNPEAVCSSLGVTETRMVPVDVAIRGVLSKITTLRLAADAAGDIGAALAADELERIAIGLKGRC